MQSFAEMSMSDEPIILIVDDEPNVRAGLGVLLSLRGYVVMAAADGVEAVRIAKSRSVSLVVSDLQMPRMDGLMLLSRLRTDASTRDLPVIVLSVDHHPSSRVAALARGADDYLTKPVNEAELVACVRTLIRRRSRRPSRPEFSTTG